MSSNVKLSWKIFWTNITPWFRSGEKKVAWSGLICAIFLSLSYVALSVVLNDWSKHFFDAIENKKLDAFLHRVLLFIPIVILLVSNFCALNYVTQWLSFRWRMWMTSAIQNDWLDNKRYYKISNNLGHLDNPDQRITQDITSICYGAFSLFMSLFKSGINFITFAIILWGVSKNISVPYKGDFIVIPGLLLWAALFYSLLGIFITFKIGRPLIALDRLQERYEADFRRRLIRVIERSEEVATIFGEEFERNRLKESFGSIAQNYYIVN